MTDKEVKRGADWMFKGQLGTCHYTDVVERDGVLYVVRKGVIVESEWEGTLLHIEEETEEEF